jgi:hypothetical protein
MPRPNSTRPGRSHRPQRPSKSIAPAASAASLALRQLVKSHGGVEPGMLEALLEDVAPERLQELRASSTVASLLDRANKILVRADKFLREASSAQRTKLRCFSTEMLALAADQAFRLGHALETYNRIVDEDARAKLAHQEALAGAAALVEQASKVLKRVQVANKNDVQPEEKPAGEGAASTAAVTEALTRLARAGERVLRSGEATVKNRAILYGLDGSYLESLARMSTRLTELSAQVNSAQKVRSAQKALDEAHAITAYLLQQVADAFDTAHKLDRAIPRLEVAEQAAPSPRAATGPANDQAPIETRVLGATVPRAPTATK